MPRAGVKSHKRRVSWLKSGGTPRSLQRNCQGGRKSASRRAFQESSEKSVSGGLEWSAIWTMYVK